MKKWMYSLVAIPVLLFGCGGEEPKVDTLDSGIMPVEVVVEIQTPEHLNVNETVQLAARVTQGDEAVEDAEEVKFEVWESGLRDDGQMLDGKLTEDGVYAIDHTFDHDGVYYMFAHTTARGLHVMPKQQLVVGNPDMSKVLEEEGSASMDHGAGHEENTDSEEKDSH